MATFTNLLRLNQQGTGDNQNTWGQVLNTQLALIEDAIAGSVDITLAANDYNLTANDGSEDEARYAVLNLQGQPSEALNVIVPDQTKIYLVRNNTTGTNDVTVRTQLGSGVKVPRDEARWLYCDGTNVVFAAKSEDSRKVGGMVPGDAVTRNVDPGEDDGLLDREALDERYVQSGNVSSVGNFTTGDVKVTFKLAENGWVRMNDGSIGPAGSGATSRADDDAEALYKLLWDNVDDDWAPVSGGRGATSDDDWNAAKPLSLPLTLGRALAVSGAGSSLTSRDLGETLGEEEHTLTEAELPTFNGVTAGEDAVSQQPSGAYPPVSIESVGENEPHNNMPPTTFVNVLIKL